MSDGLFPFIDSEIEDYVADNSSIELETVKEYAWDFENNRIILESGKTVIVEGIEAVRVWIYKVLNTKRDNYPIYSEDYGFEKEVLIRSKMSHDMIESEVKRLLEEALYVNPHINSVEDISLEITKHKVTVSFTVKTTFGDAEVTI